MAFTKTCVGRGDGSVGSPRRAQNLSIRAFRAYPLVEARQTAPWRAPRIPSAAGRFSTNQFAL